MVDMVAVFLYNNGTQPLLCHMSLSRFTSYSCRLFEGMQTRAL